MVEDGVVRGLNPHFLTAVSDAVEFTRLKLSFGQLFPEQPVFTAGTLGRIHKHTVMLALNFLQGVTHGIQEVVVGLQDFSRRFEFNNGLRLVDRIDLTREIGVFHFFCGNVDGVFYYPGDFAVACCNRVVGGLNPHLVTRFVVTQVFAAFKFTFGQFSPEVFVFGRLCVVGCDKHSVVFTRDFA